MTEGLDKKNNNKAKTMPDNTTGQHTETTNHMKKKFVYDQT